MAPTKSPRRVWPYVAVLTLLTISVALLFYTGRGRSDTSIEVDVQRTILAPDGFHTDRSGKAIDDYVAALRLLQKAGWTEERLGKYRDEGGPLPAADSLSVLEDAASLVIRGAKRRNAGIPRISLLQTTAIVGSGPVDLLDVGLVSDATLIVARYHLQNGDYVGAGRLAAADFALGLHLMTSDQSVLTALGIVHRQKALAILKRIASKKNEPEKLKTYDRIEASLDAELRAHKRQHGNEKPSTMDIIDYFRGP